MKKLFILFSLFIAFAAQARVNPAVFKDKMVAHKARVLRLGLEVFSAFPAEYSGLNESLVRGYLLLHDNPKLQSLSELRAWGYTGQETINKRLSRFYSENVRAMEPSAGAELKDTVQTLNAIEELQKLDFFRRNGVAPEQIAALKHLEHVVDVTDTAISRREEFRIQGNNFRGGEKWLLKEHDLMGARISKWIEANYFRLLHQLVTPELRCQILLGAS